MKRLLPLLLLVAALPGAAQQPVSRYIVGTRRAARVTPLRLLQDGEEVRERAVRTFDVINGFAADLSSDDVAELRRSKEVRYVVPVVERHLLDAAPRAVAGNGSPYAAAQSVPYGIDLVHAREVWPITKGGKGNVNVAILDTGLDLTHPDVKDNYAGGINTIEPDKPPQDDNRHGTHVAGIIAGEDNAIGIVGVAPEAKLWIVKVLDGAGRGFDEDIIEGIDWVIAQKAARGGNWIVSMSFGSDTSSTPEAEAFKKLVDAGVLPVAAAGNRSFAQLDFPGGYPGVYSVGAVDSKSVIADFSSGGPTLGIVAPGVDIVSSLPVASILSGSAQLSGGVPAINASPLIGAKHGELTAPFVKCGIGMPQDFPPDTAGKIALIQRGGSNYTFSEKVRAAKDAGAIGAIIYNDDRPLVYPWTLIRPDCGYPDGCHPFEPDATYDWPIVVSITKEEGEALAAVAGSARPITIGIWTEDYGKLSGTSMATPHISGIAALLWSIAPKSTPADVRNAISFTAHDLGLPGHDIQYGFGLADAYEAARMIAPAAFGIDNKPPDPTARRRSGPH